MPEHVEKTTKIVAKNSGLIVLTKTQLAYYAEGMPKMISYVFPPEVARDMDIVNQNLLTTQLKDFIAKNKLQAASISILLANDILFARESKATAPEDKKNEIDTFVDLVPFEYPSTKSITFDNKTYITVANKEYYESVMNVFTDNGFTMHYVLPLYVFAKEIDLKKGVTSTSALQLIKRIDVYKQYNFHELAATQEYQIPEEPKKMQLQVKGGKSNHKFVIIGLVFMLIGVAFAAYLYWSMYMTPQQPQKLSNAEQKHSQVAKAASPTPAVLGAASTTILLQHTAADQETAAKLLTNLSKKGFKNIRNEFTEMYNFSTTVTFSSSVSAQLKEIVLTELKSIYPDVFVQEVASPAADIVLLLTPDSQISPTVSGPTIGPANPTISPVVTQ